MAEETRNMDRLKNTDRSGNADRSRDRAYRIGPIRPPSEAKSLLLQVTNGCTWNRCKFCTIYRDTRFKAFSADSVKEDIDTIAHFADQIRPFRRQDGSWDMNGLNARLMEIPDYEARQSFYMTANWLIGGGENVFLQDGNTTALSSGRLADVLIYLKQTFPQIRRITSYGRAAEMSRHDSEYFAELKEAGLDRIHSGYESGSDEVLTMINKGCTSAQEIAAGRAVKAGGIELSIYFMPGIGGRELSRENAAGTARVVNEVDPDFLRIRTAAIKPGSDIYSDFFHEDGTPAEDHTLCSDDDKVREIRDVIEQAEGVSTRIVSDHMVNLLQTVEGPMCGPEKKKRLQEIDTYLLMPEIDRRVFQLLRRTLRAYDLDEMRRLPEDHLDHMRKLVREEPASEWDQKMNRYICRYI